MSIRSIIRNILKKKRSERYAWQPKICSKCLHYKTMDCPNSYLCHSTEDRPHLKNRKKHQ